MDDTYLMKDQPIPEYKGDYNYWLNKEIPSISLLNQDGNLLKLNRTDTFRLVLYFYSMTGNPKKKLPKNWNEIPGASGCTLENCSFRDNYEKLIELNTLPIGISTQSIKDIKEMTLRLGIQFDILSDYQLELTNKLLLPTFSVDNKIYIKKITMIVENNLIKKIFYPINLLDKHVDDIIEWLKKN